MTYLIFEPLLTKFFYILLASMILFLGGAYQLSKYFLRPSKASIATNMMAEIAGDDQTATALDLARAYLEIDQKQEARNILHSIQKNGSIAAQHEATTLLKKL